MSDPFEYQPDEEPGDDDRALWAEAAADQAEQEYDEATKELIRRITGADYA